MRFKGLDLNLLVALDALLDEKSVTRASERLHLSQPAMTAALGRIRDYFDDPILRLHGKRMVPTSHALSIHKDLKAVLGDIDTLISKTSSFEPSSSSRKFKITASDYMTQIVLVPLLRKFQSIAPNIKVEITPPADSTNELLAQGRIDLVFIPSQMLLPDQFPSETLFKERFVVVGCKKNPVFKNVFTEEQFYNAGQVVVKLGRLRPMSMAEQMLETRKKTRETDVLVSSFHLAPEMVIGTDRITVMHERFAKIFAERLPIAIAEIPFDFPALEECVQYHGTRADDAGIRWMINQVKESTIT